MQPTSLAFTPTAPRAVARDAPAAPALTLAADTRSVSQSGTAGQRKVESMQTRSTGFVLLTLAVLVVCVISAEAGERITGTMTATQTDSMTVWLEWTVESLAGVEGFRLMRQADPPVGAWAFITQELLPPESPGSYEDHDVWAPAEFRYALYATLVGGTEVLVEGTLCVVMVSGSPVDQGTWSLIKAMFR